MKTIQKIFEGKKTYIGLIVALIGVLGIGQFVTPIEGTELVNHVWGITGILMAVYGRIVTKGV